MAYPVTLNGRTYTLADFEGTNYVDGLPDAFEDFVTHAGDIYNDTSTSSVAIGTGSKTFTVSSAKPYQAGTPLRIADSANPDTNFLDCIVTSYSGTTLVVNAFGYAGSGTIASWTINIGGAKTVDGTLAVSQGGTGATTASDARTNLDVYSKADADSRFLNVSGEASNVTMTGDVTIGDTAGDTLTVNATATFANGVSFGDNVISGDDIDGGTISNFASTGIDDNATSTAITIDSSQNVAIGRTANIAHPLDIQKADDAYIRISSGTTQENAGIIFANQNTTKWTLEKEGAAHSLFLKDASSTAVTFAQGGNVGIGTSSPTTTLQINKDSTSGASGGLTLKTADSNESSLSIGVSTSLGRAFISSLQNGTGTALPLDFITGSSSTNVRMRIDADGNVGIGTTTIDADLHLGAASPHIDIGPAAGNRGKVGFDSNNVYIGSTSSTGQIHFKNNIGSSDAPHSSGDTKMVIADSGVGIGTTSPTFGSGSGLEIEQSGTATVRVERTGATATSGEFFAGNDRVVIGSTSNTHLELRTNSTERMRIDSSGNVGIGTSSPSGKLSIAGGTANDYTDGITLQKSGGNVYGIYPSTNNLEFRSITGNSHIATFDFSGNVGIGTASPLNQLVISEGTGQHGIEFAAGTTSYIQAYDRAISDYGDLKIDAQIIQFGTDNGTERMRIDSSGNLLVGTTSVLAGNKHCFVDSSSDTTVAIQKSGGSGNLPLAVWNTGTTGDNLFVKFFTEASATERGNIDYNRAGGQVRYNVTSDQRLKENIVDAPSASDDIDAIQVRSFDWIESGYHQSYGLVAQELLTVVPDAVRQPEDPEEMMGVDYSKLVPMMLKEIQSLRARVAQLEGA